MSSISKLTMVDLNQLSYVAMDAILFVGRNISDIERIAATFCHYDIADAVKLCMENGLNNLLTTCDMDDEMNADDQKEAKE